MKLKNARILGLNLARTLMTIIVLVKTAKGYSVIPLAEYDGDPEFIVCEYDPFGI